MIDTQKIERIVEHELAGTELFLVEVKVSPANEVEVVIDSDESVAIEACARLSRAIEAEFDRETEDFELTVTSAGIGQPFKLERQYSKHIGRSVEIVLRTGQKLVAELRDVERDAIVVAYTEMQTVEGAKRKRAVEVVTRYLLADIKSTKEYLDFS